MKYAGLGIDWFQKKGFDFTEELNSAFIQLCLENDQLDPIKQRFLIKKNRISSWTTPSSIYKLLSSLQTKEDYNSIIDLTEILTSKGVRPDLRSFEIVFHACLQLKAIEKYETFITLAKNLLKDEEIQTLQEKYPKPTN